MMEKERSAPKNNNVQGGIHNRRFGSNNSNTTTLMIPNHPRPDAIGVSMMSRRSILLITKSKFIFFFFLILFLFCISYGTLFHFSWFNYHHHHYYYDILYTNNTIQTQQGYENSQPISTTSRKENEPQKEIHQSIEITQTSSDSRKENQVQKEIQQSIEITHTFFDTTKSPSSFSSSSSSHAYLSCEKYGGPMNTTTTTNNNNNEIQSMVYWSDIPSDAKYTSPYFKTKKNMNKNLYLTFEPDLAAWNNRRMALETIFVMAHSMGRTIVIPPSDIIYLMEDTKNNQQKVHFSFADLYPLHSLDQEHDGVDIISMEEYLTREAGHFKNKVTGQVSWPPDNRTQWDGHDPKPLYMWLRNVSYTPMWNPDHCMLLIPSHATSNITYLQEIHEQAKAIPRDNTYITPVNASLKERMVENLIGRDLCIYNQTVQEEPSIHLMCSYTTPEVRFLVHFYAFVLFEDFKQQLWSMRFVRDHLRYMDEIQCAAARVIQALKRRSLERNSSNYGVYDSFHIRRGDFEYQYNEMIVDASNLYQASQDVIPSNSTVYVATDERNKTYFQELATHYDLVFIDDILPLVQGLNSNYFGMLDQLIASKSRYFFGTFYSTFSGYINRLRGYQSTKHKLDGFQDGIIESYYFHPDALKHVMRQYEPIHVPLWSREFPLSWRDIDRGISELWAEGG